MLPWKRCKSVGVFSSSDWARCELRRGHGGPHQATGPDVWWGPYLSVAAGASEHHSRLSERIANVDQEDTDG